MILGRPLHALRTPRIPDSGDRYVEISHVVDQRIVVAGLDGLGALPNLNCQVDQRHQHRDTADELSQVGELGKVHG